MADLGALKAEWGATYEGNVSKAARIAQQFFPNSGLTDAIKENAVGAGTLRDLNALAMQLGSEGQQLIGERGAGGANTPQELRDQANELANKIREMTPGPSREALIQKRMALLTSADRGT